MYMCMISIVIDISALKQNDKYQNSIVFIERPHKNAIQLSGL